MAEITKPLSSYAIREKVVYVSQTGDQEINGTVLAHVAKDKETGAEEYLEIINEDVADSFTEPVSNPNNVRPRG